MHAPTPISMLPESVHELPNQILVEHFVVQAEREKDILVQNDRDRLGFFFCLSGQNRITVQGSRDPVHMRKGVCGSYREAKGLVRSAAYDPAETFSMVSISMPPETMSAIFQTNLAQIDIFPEEKNTGRPYAFRFMPAVPHINTAVSQVINPPVAQCLRPAYMEGKALEVTALMLEAIFSGQRGHGVIPSLNSRETALLCHAREILTSRMEDPLSLTEIARLSGLSLGRLNQGFKALFGQTAHDLLKEHRLEKARILLASGEYNVTEACMQVGYTNLSHFAKIYKQHFGVSPIKDRKRFFPIG